MTWETFRDEAYYDMWCVRRVGDTEFGQGFHVASKDEAEALVALLSSPSVPVQGIASPVVMALEGLNAFRLLFVSDDGETLVMPELDDDFTERWIAFKDDLAALSVQEPAPSPSPAADAVAEADEEPTYDEGYAEGVQDAKDHGVDVAKAVQRWLDKQLGAGNWWDAAQEGYTPDDVIQGLHEALREAARPAGAVLPVSDAMREAAATIVGEIVNYPQSAGEDYDELVPINLGYIRTLEAALSVQEPAPSPAVVVDEAMVERRAIADITAERRRQIEAEGWSIEHDDKHANGEMAGAAACYALTSTPKHWGAPHAAKTFWPWDEAWWKPSDPRRDLVKAGALIVAEIERLDRAALQNAGGEQ